MRSESKHKTRIIDDDHVVPGVALLKPLAAFSSHFSLDFIFSSWLAKLGSKWACRLNLNSVFSIVSACSLLAALLLTPTLSSGTSQDWSSCREKGAAVSEDNDLDYIIMELPAAFRLSPHYRAFLLYNRSPNQYIYDPYIRVACQQHGVDYNLVKAIVRAESGFRSDSVSPKGAMGLMQLMPGTAKNFKVKNSMDPYQNVDAGVRYLKQMLERFENKIILAVAAYNAGPEAVEKYHGVPPYNETQLYVQVVMVLYRHYSQQAFN
jgi:soluble lytic murein transglycosylase-like protein